ncbi:MAG: hypothetical protein ACF8XB_23675, partial [Planctomycetota bacterium JB042]
MVPSKRIPFVAAALCAAALPAVARGEEPRTPKEIVKELDADGDRKLSYEEFRKYQGNRYVFRQLDANDDDLLSV